MTIIIIIISVKLITKTAIKPITTMHHADTSTQDKCLSKLNNV